MYERTYQSRVLAKDAKPEPKRFPWKRAFWITGGIVVLVGFVLLTRTSKLQVQTIDIVGTNVADPEEVRLFTMQRLEGKYLYTLPKKSMFLIDDRSIATSIKQSFPRFKTVSVSRESTTKLLVTVTEYEGKYLWCDDACSFMDERGSVFAPAPYFSGNAYIKISIGTRGALPFVPISESELSMIQIYIDRLRDISIDPISFTFVTPRSLEIFFVHNSSESKIIIDPTITPDTALEALFSGLRTEPLQGLYHSPTILHYIDLRFPNKVVYKFD